MGNPLDARPLIVAIAGPNGAGKSTFYEAFIQQTGLRFINADTIARELGIDAYEASELAGQFRETLVAQRESFVFETVFSDPIGAKVEFLEKAQRGGYTVLLCFIGLDSAETSDDRVAMRVMQGGHDVATGKITARYPRSIENLRRAITALGFVRIYDNSDLAHPFRKVAQFEGGVVTQIVSSAPEWLFALLP